VEAVNLRALEVTKVGLDILKVEMPEPISDSSYSSGEIPATSCFTNVLKEYGHLIAYLGTSQPRL